MKNVNICFVGFLILPLLTAIASPVPQDDTDTDFLVADATDATVPQYYPQNDDEYSGKQTQQYPQNSDGNIGDQVSETGSPSSGLNLPTTNYETAMAYNIDATQNTEGSGELLAGSAGAVVKPNSVDCGGQTPLCCDDGRRSESADFRVNCILCHVFPKEPTNAPAICCAGFIREENVRTSGIWSDETLRNAGYRSGGIGTGCGRPPTVAEERHPGPNQNNVPQ